MRRLSRVLLLTLLFGLIAPAFAAGPQVGEAAPGFRLQDQHGHWREPAEFHGHWLVMYFYPKDFTPGCTTEVCTFRDDIAKLRQAGAEVVGVSLDPVKSHADFAAKYHVPFPLLSDADHQVSASYGVLTSMAGMKYAKRTTFLIDPQGRVAKVYRDVDPEKNSTQVLADLAALKGGALMAITQRAAPPSGRRFAAWAIGPWVLLLLAGMGCVQYLRHAEYGYLLAALVIVVVSAGCILRRPWARPAMRVLAVALAAWAFISGALMLSQWHVMEAIHQQAMTQLDQAAVWLIERKQRTWVVLFALKAIAIPLLFWLEHQLGRPAVRLQFRRSR